MPKRAGAVEASCTRSSAQEFRKRQWKMAAVPPASAKGGKKRERLSPLTELGLHSADLADKVVWAEKLGQKLPRDVELKIYSITDEAGAAAVPK